MAWIKTTADEQDSQLRSLLAESADAVTGKVDHILGVHALHKEGLDAHLRLYKAVMAGTKSLRKREREMIALVVSKINECHY